MAIPAPREAGLSGGGSRSPAQPLSVNEILILPLAGRIAAKLAVKLSCHPSGCRACRQAVRSPWKRKQRSTGAEPSSGEVIRGLSLGVALGRAREPASGPRRDRR